MPKTDYGLKLSQVGIDVTAAADAQLLLSSGWFNLKIEKTGTGTVNRFGATNQLVYTHNLGYPCLFLIYRDVTAGDYLGYPVPNGTYMSSDPFFYVNSTDLRYKGLNFGGTNNFSFRYYIIRLNLKQSFVAANYLTTNTQEKEKDKDYGIKVAKPGKKITSKDLRDYTIHSGTRSPMVHAVQYQQLTGSGSSYGMTWTNNLPYVPTHFSFTSSDNNNFSPLIGLEQAPPALGIGPTGNISISNTSATYGSIVVLKDPFEVVTPTTVSVP